MLGLVIPWLMNNWKLVAVGLAVLAIISYVTVLKFEVSHYKDKSEQIEAEYTLYKAGAEAKEAKLEAGAAAITKRYETALREADSQRAIASIATQEKIKANEELKRTRISFAAVRLLNESTSTAQVPAPAVAGNEASPARPEAGTVDLSVVFSVVAENNNNHLACTARLEKWITFWAEYEAVVRGAQDVGS